MLTIAGMWLWPLCGALPPGRRGTPRPANSRSAAATSAARSWLRRPPSAADTGRASRPWGDACSEPPPDPRGTPYSWPALRCEQPRVTPWMVSGPTDRRSPGATRPPPGPERSPRVQPAKAAAARGSAPAPDTAAVSPPDKSHTATAAPPDATARTARLQPAALRSVPAPEPTTAPHALLDLTVSIEAHVAFTA